MSRDSKDFGSYEINSQFNFPVEESKVLAYWRDIDAFRTQLKHSEGKQTFSFYDGPPFATGLPHYGHLLAGTVKDIVTRHAASSGYHVPRRFGWDCHGLPVEHEIDKKLGISGREDVLNMGIDKYNEECRAIVMRYSAEWRNTVERMGRWIDFDHDYKTLNTSFMESVWWAFGELFNKDLVYRGLRVMPYSTACTTPLSNFEAGQAYKDVSDPAVVVSFPLVNDPSTSFLAWTTTPWTLPSNLALCVNPSHTYLKIHDEEKNRDFIIHEKLLTTLYKDPKKAKFQKVAQYKGSDMKGWKYEPLFNYFYDEFKDVAFQVLNDDYVSADAGTGIVHQAPAFGDDDHRIAIANGIITPDQMPPCPVDDSGKYTERVSDYKGVHVKEADKDIQKYLKSINRLIVQSTINHSYPFCWRSGTPLIYKAIPVWFVKVSQITNDLIENNKETRWVPANIGENRFGNWLQNARDWNVSRNRYWGTPMPLWVSEDYEEIVAISSIEQLEQLSGVSNISDIHRDKIDHITIPSKKGKGVLKRVDEVFDCWFESGSMPYAQAHYPFENKEEFEKSFPADFVSEGLDQTRGWFYTLLVLGTHLLGKAPWKNLIVTGLVLAADGKKMSKSLKNYPDPNHIIDKYGADAVRMFLVNSPIVRGDNLRFREEGVKEVTSRVMLPWLNSFRFFLGQAALAKKEQGIEFMYDASAPRSENLMDRWVLARCQSLIKIVKEEMAAYRLYTVIPRLLSLIDELTNWYIRFNRRRLKGENGKEDTIAALRTLFEALFTLCRTMSSFTPFITENLYQGLRPFIGDNIPGATDTRSVHFLPFPDVREDYFDSVIERRVSRMQNVIELGRVIRERKRIAVKTPLKTLIVFHHKEEYLSDVRHLEGYIKEELNVRELVVTSEEEFIGIKYKVSADWPVLGRKLRKDMPRVKNNLPKVSNDDAKGYMQNGKLTVDGIELQAGDLTVHHYVDLPESMEGFEPISDSNITIVLDYRLHPELESEGLAREFINRIQRLRKKANLLQIQDVDVVVKYLGEDGDISGLQNAIEMHKDTIVRSTKSNPLSDKENAQVIATEDQEIGAVKFNLTLVGA
ncbi:hypothetical protein E3P96_02654 [Wallemia ichthyophaga]|nr:hypothetical protein E3P98_02802 [Wallemia ichthyophaga]TIB00413.1 hypothetical protein E3P96_02654 [Wallemia ichthyophaga]